MSFVSFATKKRLFHQITPKNGIVPCHSNWVMWPIKIFGLSQGFLISTLLGYQNEFCFFRNQKTLFLPNNAKKRYCSLSFKLGHVTYWNIWREPRILAHIFSLPIFCRKQYFVVAVIFYLLIFCRKRYFVNVNFWSKAIFCRRRYFFYADILSAAIFCRQRNFVGSDILSKAIFWRRRYFSFANILAKAIFC